MDYLSKIDRLVTCICNFGECYLVTQNYFHYLVFSLLSAYFDQELIIISNVTKKKKNRPKRARPKLYININQRSRIWKHCLEFLSDSITFLRMTSLGESLRSQNNIMNPSPHLFFNFQLYANVVEVPLNMKGEQEDDNTKYFV